jgi:flagellar biosynthesis protein FlhG
LERSHRYLIIDTGTGIHRPIRQFAAASDVVLVLTTPELTSIADAYALVKALANHNIPAMQILVNQSASPEQARRIIDRLQQTSRCFLRVDVGSAGHIPHDPGVARAVSRRRPFVLDAPHSPASRAMQQLARRLLNQTSTEPASGTFFSRLWQRFEQKAA